MTSSQSNVPAPQGPGSVSGAPNLPEAPDEMLAALTPFLAPYRDARTAGVPASSAAN
jgi:hypothetical protein